MKALSLIKQLGSRPVTLMIRSKHTISLICVVAGILLPLQTSADDKFPRDAAESAAPSTVAPPASNECEAGDCENDAQVLKPAYTLKIITYGEGNPAEENLTEEGLQQNRRVDVTILGEPTVAENENKIDVNRGGILWITKDPLVLDRELQIKAPSVIYTVDGAIDDSVNIRLFSNYTAFIERWEVIVFDAEDTDLSRPLTTISGDELGYDSELEWNGVLDSGEQITRGDELQLVFRVYGDNDQFDETFPEIMTVAGPATNLDEDSESAPSLEDLALVERSTRFQLAREEIVIRGSRVRLYGRDLLDAKSIQVNGESVKIDDNVDFAAEYLLPNGEHEFDVEIEYNDGAVHRKKLSATLDDKYLFLVALADITVGKNTVSGSIDRLEVDDEHHYGGDIFVDGRLAFYLKGKIQGKYLVTAQMDTETQAIDEVFNGLSRANPASVFRRLDPEQYYPVYGDDSTLVDDTDSQGKLYIRVDWDQSRLLWGNYNSGITGTEFSRFNRSMYGAQLLSRSKKFTDQGEHVTSLNLFASESQSAHGHNEFLGTGGSLYYLNDQDIVKGSEKIAVEVRQANSNRVLERIEMQEGRDYQIDDYQGRIILNRPLQSVGSVDAPSIIKDTPLDGSTVWLVVDYEYVPSVFNKDEVSVGGRGKHWLNDHFAIGGTWVVDRREGFDHQIKGLDATLTSGPGTWLRAEYAQSNNAQSAGSYLSDDGGLSFTPFDSNLRPTPTQGNAMGVEARVDVDSLRESSRESHVGAWYKKREAGFSSGSFDTGTDTIDAGAEASVAVGERLRFSARATQVEKVSEEKRQSASVQAEVKATKRLSVAGELRSVTEESFLAASSGEGTLGALRIGVDVTENVNLYGSAQRTIEATGSYETNDLNTLGVRTTRGQHLSLNAEVSSGTRGDSALLGSEYKVNKRYSLYANNTFSADRNDSFRNATTVGQRGQLSSRLRVFTEHQFTNEDEQAGLGHTFGLDFNPVQSVTLSASYQMANLEKDSGEDVERDAVSLGIDYKNKPTHLSSRLEYRRDKSDLQVSEQYLTANSFSFQASRSVRWQGRFNYSQTKDPMNNDADAKFAEAGLGFALRPWNHDRLNMLGRVTYKFDLPPIGQSTATDERAVVASLEGAYQMNQYWEIGGKAAYKDSEIRTSRNNGPWLGNDAVLAATRLRFHFPFRWDALAEYHWLFSDASNDTEHGVLLTLGRHVGNNLKFEVGYNFTRFDDNLLNDNIDIGGWFVNLVGKY